MKLWTTLLLISYLLSFANSLKVDSNALYEVVNPEIYDINFFFYFANRHVWLNTPLRKSIMKYMEDYDILSEIKDMNSDLRNIFDDMPDKLKENLLTFQEKIGLVDDNYETMLFYSENYENTTLFDNRTMIFRCYSILENGINAPVNLIDDAVKYLAYEDNNIFDVLTEISQVRTKFNFFMKFL